MIISTVKRQLSYPHATDIPVLISGSLFMMVGFTVHKFYGLFPTALLDSETEEMIHDEGLLARFWGVWFDCVMCFNTMVEEAKNGGASASPRWGAQR